jgi:methyl-accepting chemotaxis protein
VTPQEATALVVSGAAALAAVGWAFKRVRRFFRFLDRAETLLQDTARTVDKELTRNGGSSIKDQVARLSTQANTNADSIASVRGLVQLLADEVSKHGHQSRAALAIYRKGLADQGVHLPVAPGEDGLTDDDLDLYFPSHREDHS